MSDLSYATLHNWSSQDVEEKVKNVIFAIQQIHVNPRKAFKEMNERVMLECAIDKPLVRIKDLVPNVMYNIICSHDAEGETYFTTLILDNVTIRVPFDEENIGMEFLIYNGSKIIFMEPSENERGGYCFCPSNCKECLCFRDEIDEHSEPISHCTCLLESRSVIAFNLETTLKRLPLKYTHRDLGYNTETDNDFQSESSDYSQSDLSYYIDHYDDQYNNNGSPWYTDDDE